MKWKNFFLILLPGGIVLFLVWYWLSRKPGQETQPALAATGAASGGGSGGSTAAAAGVLPNVLQNVFQMLASLASVLRPVVNIFSGGGGGTGSGTSTKLGLPDLSNLFGAKQNSGSASSANSAGSSQSTIDSLLDPNNFSDLAQNAQDTYGSGPSDFGGQSSGSAPNPSYVPPYVPPAQTDEDFGGSGADFGGSATDLGAESSYESWLLGQDETEGQLAIAQLDAFDADTGGDDEDFGDDPGSVFGSGEYGLGGDDDEGGDDGD